MPLSVNRVKQASFGVPGGTTTPSATQSTALTITETHILTGTGIYVPRMGIYTSGNNLSSGYTAGPPETPRGDARYPGANTPNTPLNTLTSAWPKKPNHVSYYMVWNSTPVTSAISTYASQGRTMQISWSTKISAGNFVLWSDISAGVYDSHIISIINAYDALGVEVSLALDVEPDNASNPGVGIAAGQTAAEYKAAANHWADLIHANATNVKSLVWLTGSCPLAYIPSVSKLDYVGWDPYKRGTETAETATSLFNRAINSTLVPNGYTAANNVGYRITETGIKTDVFGNGGFYTVAAQIDFYQNQFPQAFDDIPNLKSIIWFRANSGSHNYIPANNDTTVDNSFRDMLNVTI